MGEGVRLLASMPGTGAASGESPHRLLFCRRALMILKRGDVLIAGCVGIKGNKADAGSVFPSIVAFFFTVG